jgi:integrase/recombinase XerD
VHAPREDTPRRASEERPLSEHVQDWRKSLFDRGATRDYAELSVSRVSRILRGIGARFWSELDANRVSAFLASLREDGPSGGLSIESTNHYLRRMKQFARWMVKSQRAPENPLDCLALQNSRTDRRHVRRALTKNELLHLLKTTRSGESRCGMSGEERYWLYRLAVETGLRASELRSLTWASFDLHGAPPTVTVRAAHSKHRRDDSLPLKAATAESLACWRDASGEAGADCRIFANAPAMTARMLRGDLRAAEIPYRDASGRVFDFHAFRHTFITNLARGGVHPKTAQALARHSTITLTMDRYSHTVIGEQAGALSTLPDLSTVEPQQERQRATGTEAAGTAPRISSSISSCLPEPKSSGLHRIASTGAESSAKSDDGQAENIEKQSVFCTSLHSAAFDCSEDEEDAPKGTRTPAAGLKSRCPRPLDDGGLRMRDHKTFSDHRQLRPWLAVGRGSSQ